MTADFSLKNGKIPYYESALLASYGVRHAFFTRIGGVSKGKFASLNFAAGAGEITDDWENVVENHKIAASVFGLTEKDVCRTYQTHTSRVETATNADRGRGLTLPPYDHGVDGLITTEKDLLLSVRSADCVPVLLCDKNKTAVSACHSGWRGTVGGITENAAKLMTEKGIDKRDILAAIGPCIGACCYEVGIEVYESFIQKDKNFSICFEPKENDKFMLDLTKANELVLLRAGLLPENISCANICTRDNEKEFFSHRRDGVVRGTMSAFICL